KGIKLFDEAVAGMSSGQELSGEVAFKLYDEQGFPYDLTELMARERGLSVDRNRFAELMEEQRRRSQESLTSAVITLSEIQATQPTRFVGYDQLETTAQVLETLRLRETDGKPGKEQQRTVVILDCTACYAAMGGQIGDTGLISGSGQLW